ncbi:2-C-methyl-D-erythritol 4-phosphate cytidylyltransferase [Sporosarcina luteola]|nr:2-C-methyl-D-erythritol 4-phosphate cytidylyltransferase [Sporosarcina luteola]
MVSFILLAAGKGSRVEQKMPKQYVSIAGKPLLLHVLDKLTKIQEIDQLIICCELEYSGLIDTMIANHYPGLAYELIEGGATRQQSVWHGLQVCKNETVVIHEAARPFVRTKDFLRLIQDEMPNVIYGADIPFTVLKGKEFVEDVLKRDELVNVQLPQKFVTSRLKEAYKKALANKQEFTEDAGLFYTYCEAEKIKVLKGLQYNIKVTYPIDFLVGEVIYREYIVGREE